MIDAIGWIATAMTIISMTFKSMWRLRFLNALSCLVWITYGYLISNNPTMFVNSIILMTHIHWFVKNREPQKRAQKSGGDSGARA
jgi:uncharacterized BrkB/YihY/UPF0761 family membrane protein